MLVSQAFYYPPNLSTNLFQNQNLKNKAQGTETYAVRNVDPDASGEETFKLYGYKWFSSATDSDMTLTLARMSETTKSGELV